MTFRPHISIPYPNANPHPHPNPNPDPHSNPHPNPNAHRNPNADSNHNPEPDRINSLDPMFGSPTSTRRRRVVPRLAQEKSAYCDILNPNIIQ